MSEEELEKNDGEYITASEARELKKPDAWQMPQPVFRQTSGYLPQGFEKQFSPAPAAPEAAASPEPMPASIDVEPQPYVSEEFTDADLARPAPVRPSGASRSPVVFVVIGLAVVAALAVGFAVLVYFLLFARGGETSF